MICIKCNKEIPEGSNFCNHCGAPQTQKPKQRGNRQGTVYKSGTGYTAEMTAYDWDGYRNKRVRKRKSGFKTKTAALNYLPTLRQQIEQELHGESRKPATIAELYSFFEKTKVSEMNSGLAGKYSKAYERIESIQDREVRGLKLGDLQGCIDGLTREQGKYVKTLLNRLYELAIVQGETTVKLSEYITLPKEQSKEREPFTLEEIDKIWNGWQEGNTFCGYVLLMIYSGMMPAELLSATWEMVDFEARTITGAGKKTDIRKQTPIVFAEVILPVLRELQGDSGRICPYTKDQFYRRFSDCMAECGCRPLRPYSCRHTTATAMAEANVNPMRMQKVMRHANIKTTMHYVHPDTDFAREGVDEIGKLRKADGS